MNLEKDIPDYAMVPAKEIEEKILHPITNDAIYSPIEFTNVTEGENLTFTIEEDLLVPDIKPDLKDILLIQTACRLTTREIKSHVKEEDYITLSGEIHLQTLYIPEKPNPHCPLISMENKIPFKEQCRLFSSDIILLDCSVEKVEHLIINERKYRIKATVKITPIYYNNMAFNLFDGIKGEPLYTLRENIEFCTLSLRKKDILSIKEYISPISDTMPGQLLLKDIKVLENYRQLTNDKVVVNGFICLNILYSDKSPIDDSSAKDNLHQIQQRVEFTQFIPLQATSSSGDCKLTFDSSDLKLKICQHEDGQDIIQLEGDLITYVETYRKSEKAVITDAYHKDKTFVCNIKENKINVLVGSTISDSSVREIFVPQDLTQDVEAILFTTGEITNTHVYFEQGKIVTEGNILAKILCQLTGDECKLATVSENIPFRLASSIGNMSGNEEIHQDVCLKEFWSEKINGKQLEFNASISTYTEAIKMSSFEQIENPAFQSGSSQENISPMIIYCCRENDNLWHVAKRFKTSKESIMEINHLEKEDLHMGQKLLVMR